ncbi:MAG: hypothetical protein OHK0052_11470 [Anaerolineales bacterium]
MIAPMQANSPKPVNIQTRIAQLLFLQILLPLLSISLLILLSLGVNESQRFQGEQRRQIQDTAERVDEYLTHAQRVLRVLKETGQNLTNAEIENILQSTWQAYPYFNSFLLLNRQGIIVGMAPPSPQLNGLDMSRQPYFTQAQSNPNQQIISKPFRSPQTGNPTIYIAQRIDENRLLVGELSLKALQDYLIARGNGSPNSVWAITDANGNLLAHTTARLVSEQTNIGASPVFQGAAQSTTTLHVYDVADNQWVVGSRIRLANTGWVILTQTTFYDAYGQYGYSALGLLLITSLVWLLLVIAVRRQFNQQLVQPLLLLGQQAAALINGQVLNPIDESPLYHIYEIAALNETFRTMQRAITQRENALRSSEARYRNLVQTSPDAIVLTDLAGNILFCNQQGALLYGIEDPTLLNGHNLAEFFPPEQGRTISRQALQSLQRNLRQMPRIESPITRKTGEIFIAEINAAITTDENDQPQGFIAILRDITPRKHLENALIRRERFLFLLNQITQEALLAPSLSNLLNQLPNLLKELFDGDNGYITRWNPETHEVIPTAASNNHEAYVGLRAQPAEGSLTASVLQIGHPLGIQNVLNSPYIAPEIAKTFPDKAMLAMPLIAREQPLGAALIGYTQEHAFSVEELENASQVAQQIALALLQLQLLEATQKQVIELRILHNLATATATITDEKHLLDYTVQTIADDLRLPHIGIWLLNPEIGQLEVIAYHPKHKSPSTAPIRLGKGLLGHIALHGNTLTSIKSPLGMPQIEPLWHESRTQLAIAIKVQEAPTGLLVIESPIPNAFSQQEQTLLTTISRQISTALERIRLFDAEKRRRQEAETLRAATNALTSTLKLEQVLERILLHIRQVIAYDSASIFLLRDNLLQVVAANGFAHPEEIIGITYDAKGNELFEETMRTGNVIIIPDARADPRFKGWGGTFNVRGWMSIPLMIRGQIIGYMTLDNYQVNAYGENDAAVARAFANQAASAIQNARLFEQNQIALMQTSHLYHLTKAIIRINTMPELLQTVAQGAASALHAHRAIVILFDTHSKQVRHIEYGGTLEDNPPATDYETLMQGLTGWVMQENRPTISPKDSIDPRESETVRTIRKTNQTGAIMVAPISHRGEILGTLTTLNQINQRDFTAQDLELLTTIATQTAIAIENIRLFEDLRRSNQNLTLAYDATIEGWSRALELRDHETQGHTLRVTEMTVQFAQLLGFDKETIVHIRRGALLHDIGKMGVPDRILQKPDQLTPEEWQIMRLHPQYAYEMLAPIEYLHPALDIPYCHHEKWDGSGYPRGLKGEQIPIAARIFAIIDVWDALTSPRPYRSTVWSETQTMQHIQKDAGTHFDPALVKIFVEWRTRSPRHNTPGSTRLN